MVRKRLPDDVYSAPPRLLDERAADDIASGIRVAARDEPRYAAHRRLRLVEDSTRVADPRAAPSWTPRRKEVRRLASGGISVVADLRVIDPVLALQRGKCVEKRLP